MLCNVIHLDCITFENQSYCCVIQFCYPMHQIFRLKTYLKLEQLYFCTIADTWFMMKYLQIRRMFQSALALICLLLSDSILAIFNKTENIVNTILAAKRQHVTVNISSFNNVYLIITHYWIMRILCKV